MGKKHKNKVRVLPGRMYRLVRSDRSVYCDAENALRTCFIEETKEQQAAREEGELCRFVRMAPDGDVELISNAGNVVRFKNAEDLTKTLRFAKDVLRITEVLKMGIGIELKSYIEKIIKERAARKWTRRKAVKVPDGLPHMIALDDRTDDELTDELRYKWSFCPIVTKEKEGYVSMFVPGGNVIRFKDKEATQLIFDAIMRSFDRV